MTFSCDFLNELNKRGFLYQCTDFETLDKACYDGEKFAFYIGFDPTAKSLHVGHLLWIKLVEKLQHVGLKPIVICGGATSKIGDPTWKDKQRVPLDDETIASNSTSILSKLEQLIDFKNHDNSAILLNNDSWLSSIRYMEFLRDFGALFSVNKMLAMDSVSTRLSRQQHLSFLEFNYMILQAFDFLHLFEHHDCRMQIGGADQWSNMISGVDLIRRKTGKQAFGLSIPLLTTSDGSKMGKTANGTVWLNDDMTSPFNFWQFWRNVDDLDVSKLLKLFTTLPLNDLEMVDNLVGSVQINDWKIVLADAVTSFVHPDTDISQIHSTATGNYDNPISSETINLSAPVVLEDLLVVSGFAQSKTAAKRLIDGSGVRVDGIINSNYKFSVCKNCIISIGKKKIIHIVFK
jgi:tyrosyl-tRNA synthetase